MSSKYLDSSGLAYFWEKIKSYVSSNVPTKTSDLNNDSNFVSDASYVHTDTNYTQAEKTKLDGIAAGATVNVVDSALSSSSTNAVQNKVINTALGNKVDKVTGYSLTKNDFTDTLKSKLDNIEAGAEVNVIETVKVNNTALTPTSKAVNVTVPTKTSDLTNDSGFVTNADIPEGAAASTTTPKMDGTATTGTETAFARGDHVHPTDTSRAPLASPTFTGTPAAPTASAGTNTTQIATTAFVATAITNGTANLATKSTTLAGYGIANAYTKTETDSAIATAVGAVTQISFEIVQTLPVTGSTGVIYLVAHSHGTGDAYDEYIWLATSSSYEKIGSTDIDLSDYMLKTDMVAITTAEIDTICAA